jgi:uncharacterized pyridoxamine 5'-phosphate oxidase family protein
MDWKTSFKEGKEIIFSTTSNECKPNANIVISLGFVDDKILISNNQMNQSQKNIEENSNVCLIGDYIRIKGTAKSFDSGKYFNICCKKNKDYIVKNAILISINEVFDLDKLEKLK